MFVYKSVDSGLVERSKYLYILLCVVVADVEPELVEYVWSGAVTVEPDVSAFGFTELFAVCLCYKWTSQTVSLGFLSECAAD